MLTLQVKFDGFLEAVRRLKANATVYVAADANGCTVTAADPAHQTIVASRTDLDEAAAIQFFQDAKIDVAVGGWSGDLTLADGADDREPFVVAISYVSSGTGTGVWVDAYDSQPTEMQALREMYDEFRETGEVGETAFEEFVRLSKPTVAIVAPAEIQRYLSQKVARSE